MPTPVQKRGTPVCTSMANATIDSHDGAMPHQCVGQHGQAVAARTKRAGADHAGHADAGGEQLEDQQASPMASSR